MTFDGRILSNVSVLAAIVEGGGFACGRFPGWAGETFSLYALDPSRHLPAAKVRAFIDSAIAVLGAGDAWLPGPIESLD